MTPLKVLHAVDVFGQRSETFVYTVVTGHRTFAADVLCHSREHAREFPFPRVHVAPKPRSRRTLDWWLAASVERAGGRSAWRRQVDAILERVAPDVIHAHFGPIGCEMAPIARDAGVPMVTSLYGVDAAVLPYLPQWREPYARLFRDGDLFLAEGPEMRKKIVAAGAPSGRTVLQPIAIDPAKYPRWSPDNTAPVVLFVGRFVEKKGLVDAVRAFARARVRAPQARFVVVGAGPEEAAARSAVDALRVGAAVDFVGMQPHADVITRLTSAAALIHPSVTASDGDSEGGAPTILLEAQAIGVPIVATRHADIPNVVPGGPGVYLCAEHDVDALGDALAAAVLAGEPCSPRHVLEHHAISRATSDLEAKYRAVLSGRARAAV